jgi:hypothetical protein
MPPEPVAGLLVLLGGWLLGKADRWSAQIKKSDDKAAADSHATAITLGRLEISLSHLDVTITRLDASLERLWARYENHEHRITVLESRSD